MNLAMNLRPLRPFLAGILLSVPTTHAAFVSYESGPLNLLIPDNDPLGIARTLDVAESGSILSVGIRLNIGIPETENAWIGDLYAYLQHDTGISILLNRPGRTSTATFGYDDDQPLALSFSDTAANGDIHRYRTALNGSESASLVALLTGAWVPDGRNTDPDSVLDTDPRNALLASFNGQNPSGQWTLFIADFSGGGLSRLDSWGLDIQYADVPEAGTLWAAIVPLVALALIRFVRTRSPRSNSRGEATESDL